MRLIYSVLLIVISNLVSLHSVADSDNENGKLISESLKNVLPELSIASVEETAIDGIFQVETVAGEILFSSFDGKYFILGDLFAIKDNKLENLSDKKRMADLNKRKGDRAAIINAVPVDKKIIFPAQDKTKGKIAVFTDIDCGWCRKLHQEVPELNKLGIEVSYFAFPRAGINSESYNKYVSAWCAEDKLSALTKAKNNKPIDKKLCDNPVAEQYNLGKSIGISGTPAIILGDGTLIPGYKNAEAIAQALGVK